MNNYNSLVTLILISLAVAISGYGDGGVTISVTVPHNTHALKYIDGNNFIRQRYVDAYDGTVSGNKVSADIKIATDTMPAAGPVERILVDLFGYSVELAELLAASPNPAPLINGEFSVQ